MRWQSCACAAVAKLAAAEQKVHAGMPAIGPFVAHAFCQYIVEGQAHGRSWSATGRDTRADKRTEGVGPRRAETRFCGAVWVGVCVSDECFWTEAAGCACNQLANTIVHVVDLISGCFDACGADESEDESSCVVCRKERCSTCTHPSAKKGWMDKRWTKPYSGGDPCGCVGDQHACMSFILPFSYMHSFIHSYIHLYRYIHLHTVHIHTSSTWNRPRIRE